MFTQNLFYRDPRRLWETFRAFSRLAAFYVWIDLLRRRMEQEVRAAGYTEAALTLVVDTEEDTLQIYQFTDAAKAAVAKARNKSMKREIPPGAEVVPIKRAG